MIPLRPLRLKNWAMMIDVVKNCVRFHAALFQVNNEVVQFLGRDALERAVVKVVRRIEGDGLVLPVRVRFLQGLDLVEIARRQRTDRPVANWAGRTWVQPRPEPRPAMAPLALDFQSLSGGGTGGLAASVRLFVPLYVVATVGKRVPVPSARLFLEDRAHDPAPVDL